MLDSIITYLQHADSLSIGMFLFLIAFFENVIPPIPGDVPVAFIGYLISFGVVSFPEALFWSSLGSTAGFMLVFLLSRHFGMKLYGEGIGQVPHRFSDIFHRFFPPSDMALLRRKFSAHGYFAVMVNRFLFGSRAVISVMAGLMHLSITRVFLAATFSATVWNILLISGGLVLGNNWSAIGMYAAMYSIPVTVIFLAVFVFAGWRFFNERKQAHE
ncbi:MAG: DedA family protein [Chlorobiaceae bacterium]|nr:DedA family protein [Chlorobiaceae bacterium]